MIPEGQLQGNITTAERQLLWDIREELRKMNNFLGQLLGFKTETRNEPEIKGYTCKICGKFYENKVGIMQCARRHKRGG